MPQYLLAMTIFGTIGLFVKFIELPSTVIALSRGALGTLFLLLVLKLLKRRINTATVKSNFKHLVIAGVALGLNWIFLFEAYRLTSVATATLAYYMAPIILILLSPILLHERVPLGKWFCVICALFGMSLISGVWEGSESVALDGITMGLIAACFYAGVVINNKFLKGLDPYDSSIVQLAVAAIVLLPYVLFTVDFSVLKPDTTTIALTLTVGIFRIAIFSYIDPAIAILLSVFVLMEPMTTAGVIGAVLILGAALASEFVGKNK